MMSEISCNISYMHVMKLSKRILCIDGFNANGRLWRTGDYLICSKLENPIIKNKMLILLCDILTYLPFIKVEVAMRLY